MLLLIPNDRSTPDERSIPLGFIVFCIFFIFDSFIPPEINQGSLIVTPFNKLQSKDLEFPPGSSLDFGL